MSFPLFDEKELQARPMTAPSPVDAKAGERGAASCPAEPAKPTTYLRDLIVIVVVLLALAGIAWLAYHAPRWM